MTNARNLAQVAAVPYPFRNRLINGSMRIDQRNSGGVISNGAGSTYGPDRWLIGSGDAGYFNLVREAGGPPAVGSQFCMLARSLANRTVAAGQYAYISQRIEGFNVADSLWGTTSARTAVLSFWAFSNLAGLHSGVINNVNSARSYPFTYTLPGNAWTKVAVTIPGDTAGTWETGNGIGAQVAFSLGSGSTFQGPAGAWAAANYTGAIGAVQHINVLNADFRVTLAQFEFGAVATPFEYSTYSADLIACQRYYESADFVLSNAVTFGTGTFKVAKRVAPTLSLTGFGGTGATIAQQGPGSWFQNNANSVISGSNVIGNAEL